MVTRRLRAADKTFFRRLGDRVSRMILEEQGYQSLDAFALEHHDLISKPSLYAIAEGERDMKVSTLRGLAQALEISLERLISGL